MKVNESFSSNEKIPPGCPELINAKNPEDNFEFFKYFWPELTNEEWILLNASESCGLDIHSVFISFLNKPDSRGCLFYLDNLILLLQRLSKDEFIKYFDDTVMLEYVTTGAYTYPVKHEELIKSLDNWQVFGPGDVESRIESIPSLEDVYEKFSSAYSFFKHELDRPESFLHQMEYSDEDLAGAGMRKRSVGPGQVAPEKRPIYFTDIRVKDIHKIISEMDSAEGSKFGTRLKTYLPVWKARGNPQAMKLISNIFTPFAPVLASFLISSSQKQDDAEGIQICSLDGTSDWYSKYSEFPISDPITVDFLRFVVQFCTIDGSDRVAAKEGTWNNLLKNYSIYDFDRAKILRSDRGCFFNCDKDTFRFPLGDKAPREKAKELANILYFFRGYLYLICRENIERLESGRREANFTEELGFWKNLRSRITDLNAHMGFMKFDLITENEEKEDLAITLIETDRLLANMR